MAAQAGLVGCRCATYLQQQLRDAEATAQLHSGFATDAHYCNTAASGT
jgi:hypothetical protein